MCRKIQIFQLTEFFLFENTNIYSNMSANVDYTQFVNGQTIKTLSEFTLESGKLLNQVPVAYKTWGKLNSAGTNCLLLCHALSGSSDVQDWWGPLLGPGKTFDTSKFFVFCGNVSGSPYGSISPCTIDPKTGEQYGPHFPQTTIRDDVRLHKKILDILGVKSIVFAIGGSMGGMQVLEWSFFGDFVKNIVPIATSGRHSAWCISWYLNLIGINNRGEAQRQSIYSDPKYRNGSYEMTNPPGSGLSAARMTAMLTYRSRNSFEARFGRKTMARQIDICSTKEEAVHNEGSKFRSETQDLISIKGLALSTKKQESEVTLNEEEEKEFTLYSAQSYLRCIYATNFRSRGQIYTSL